MMQTDTTPTVLVIDDELGPRESLRFLLNKNHVVLCADNVDRGIEMLRTHASTQSTCQDTPTAWANPACVYWLA